MTRLRGLPAQLFLFTILPLTLLLAAIAFGGLTLHQRAMRQMVGERDERATRAAAGALEEQLQRRAAAVSNLALHAAHVPPATALADLGRGRFFGAFVVPAAGNYIGKVVKTGSWDGFGADGRSVNANRMQLHHVLFAQGRVTSDIAIIINVRIR